MTVIFFSLDELNLIYKKWLEAAYVYYWGIDEHSETWIEFDDFMWTMVAHNMKREIEHFPFLKMIDFNGTSLGVGCPKNQLLNEILGSKS